MVKEAVIEDGRPKISLRRIKHTNMGVGIIRHTDMEVGIISAGELVKGPGVGTCLECLRNCKEAACEARME